MPGHGATVGRDVPYMCALLTSQLRTATSPEPAASRHRLARPQIAAHRPPQSPRATGGRPYADICVLRARCDGVACGATAGSELGGAHVAVAEVVCVDSIGRVQRPRMMFYSRCACLTGCRSGLTREADKLKGGGGGVEFPAESAVDIDVIGREHTVHGDTAAPAGKPGTLAPNATRDAQRKGPGTKHVQYNPLPDPGIDVYASDPSVASRGPLTGPQKPLIAPPGPPGSTYHK